MLKQNLYKKKRLQGKKKILNKLFLKRWNFDNLIKHSYFYFLLKNEKLVLNKKILWLLYSTEKGSIFSLKKWIKFIIFICY
uniref:ribosomal protein L20 n=1 Tax=Hypnea musciformis TaxID=31429 RepID=UPI003003588E|nr:ribosomal protein L20 [Hypnea musciformis]